MGPPPTTSAPRLGDSHVRQPGPGRLETDDDGLKVARFRPSTAIHVGGSGVRHAGPGRLETDDDGLSGQRFHPRQIEPAQDGFANNIDKEQSREVHIKTYAGPAIAEPSDSTHSLAPPPAHLATIQWDSFRLGRKVRAPPHQALPPPILSMAELPAAQSSLAEAQNQLRRDRMQLEYDKRHSQLSTVLTSSSVTAQRALTSKMQAVEREVVDVAVNASARHRAIEADQKLETEVAEVRELRGHLNARNGENARQRGELAELKGANEELRRQNAALQTERGEIARQLAKEQKGKSAAEKARDTFGGWASAQRAEVDVSARNDMPCLDVNFGLNIDAILGGNTASRSHSVSPTPAPDHADGNLPDSHSGLGKRPSSSRDALTASTSTGPKARRGRPPEQRAVARPWADDPMWDGVNVRQGTTAPFEPVIEDDVDQRISATRRACRAAVFPHEVWAQSVIASADALHDQFASAAETTEKRHIWSFSVNLIKMCSLSWPSDFAARSAAAVVEVELRKKLARIMDKEEQKRRKQEKARRDAGRHASKRRQSGCGDLP